MIGLLLAAALSLNGNWAFRFEVESLPAIGERIPASGYDPSKPDCGLGSAKV